MFAPPASSTRSARARRFRTCFAATTVVVLGACAQAPVQDMSNTRQTIRAAEAAGAASVAPEPLASAREGLRQAEEHLKQGHYRAAQRAATDAREKAYEALQAAEAARSANPR
jgi:hypothetical protein